MTPVVESAFLVGCLVSKQRMSCWLQDSKVERLMDFLEAPKQMSDKDLAAKVCTCSLQS